MELLEEQSIAEDALGDRADAGAVRLRSERTPQLALRRNRSCDHRDRTGETRRLVQLVVRLVGEEGVVGVDPAGGQRGRARHEHP